MFVSLRASDHLLQHPFLLLCCPGLKPASLVHAFTIQVEQMQTCIPVLCLQELKYSGNIFRKERKYGNFWAFMWCHTN